MDTGIFTKKWPYRVLLLFLFFSIYSFALSPGITTGDAGELTSAAMVMGIPHPPGYPLWTLLARIFTLLFPENPGFGTNLFSMMAGIASVLLVFETVSLSAPYWLSFLAATNIGLFPQVLNYSTITEVYSLTIFFFLLLLFLYKKGYSSFQNYTLGLSLGVHPVLLIPFLVFIPVLIKQKKFYFILFLSGASILLLPLISGFHQPVVNWMGRPTLINWIKLLTRYIYYSGSSSFDFTLSTLLEEIHIYFIITVKYGWFLLPLLILCIFRVKKEPLLFTLLIAMSLPLALLLHYPPVYDSVYVNAPFFVFQFMLIIIISGAQLLQGRMKYLQLVLLIFSLFSSIAVSERNNFFRPDWTGTVFIKEASQFIRDGDVVKTSGDTFTFLLLYESLRTKRFSVKVDYGGLSINMDKNASLTVKHKDDFVHPYGPFYARQPEKVSWPEIKIPIRRSMYTDTDAIYLLITRWIRFNKNLTPEKVSRALKLISPPFLSKHVSGVCSIYLGYVLMEEGYGFLHRIFNRYRNNDEIIHYYYVFCMNTERKNEGLSALSNGIIRTGFSSPDLLNDAGIFHAEMGNSGAAMHFFTRSNTIESLKNILILLQSANL